VVFKEEIVHYNSTWIIKMDEPTNIATEMEIEVVTQRATDFQIVTKGIKRRRATPKRKGVKKAKKISYDVPQITLSPVTLTFDKKKEIIHVVNTSGDLVRELLGKNRLCPLIDTHVKLKKMFSGGLSGSPVCLVEFVDGKKKEYVVKMFKEKNQTLVAFETHPLRYYADIFEENGGIRAWIVNVNGGNESKIIREGDIVQIPQYAIGCKTPKAKEYTRFDDRGVTKVPKGSYICRDAKYSEYILSVLAAELLEDGKCVHFCNVFGFATCDALKYQGVTQYMFLEHISGGELYDKIPELKTIQVTPNHTLTDILYLQIIVAVFSYQYIFQLQHNDLHTKNILLEETKNVTYLGEKIANYNTFCYALPIGNIYLPNVPWIIKIMDYGLSVSYGSPIIGNERMFTDAYKDRNFGQYWYPNWYSPAYDVMVITHAMWLLCPSLFLNKVMEHILGSEPASYYYNKNWRPLVSELHQFEAISPISILTDPSIMGDFLVKPSSECAYLGVF